MTFEIIEKRQNSLLERFVKHF